MNTTMHGKPPPYRPAFTSYDSFSTASKPSGSNPPKPVSKQPNNNGGNSSWFDEYTRPYTPKSPTPAPAPARKPGGW